MIPLVGALLGGGASGIFGGAGGGGLMGALLPKLLGGGGLGNMLSNLLGGGQRADGGASEQTNQLLGDIKDMLGQLIDDKGAKGCRHGGGSHGTEAWGRGRGSADGCDHSSRPVERDDCDHACGRDREPECDHHREPECRGGEHHGCDGAEASGWDGRDKSPSLDRERGAARLLEQARHADDPKEKRELIEMALDMLGEGPKCDGPFGRLKEKMDGNSYDKDIVKQAEKMLDQIDEGCLSECGESKALDSVIDMLVEDGGVDGEPAANDSNGDGRYNRMDKWMQAGII